MLQRPRSVFILNLFEGTDLAFEADSQERAIELCRAPSFVQAVDRFRAHKEPASSLCYRAQPATEIQAAMYRQISDEFAELGNCVLVANLGDLRKA